METKHTKGEWFTTRGQVFCKILDIGNVKIANVVPVTPSDTEFDANAKLIAAAPDLLEALKEAKYEIMLHGDLEHIRTGNKVLEKIEAAVNKATS